MENPWSGSAFPCDNVRIHFTTPSNLGYFFNLYSSFRANIANISRLAPKWSIRTCLSISVEWGITSDQWAVTSFQYPDVGWSETSFAINHSSGISSIMYFLRWFRIRSHVSYLFQRIFDREELSSMVFQSVQCLQSKSWNSCQWLRMMAPVWMYCASFKILFFHERLFWKYFVAAM